MYGIRSLITHFSTISVISKNTILEKTQLKVFEEIFMLIKDEKTGTLDARISLIERLATRREKRKETWNVLG